MKIKLSYKEKALQQNPDLIAEKSGDSYRVIWKARNGNHILGHGKTEESSWENCVKVFYNLK